MATPDEFEVFNDTTEQIPAGGLALWSGGFTDQGALKLVKPTADSQPHLVVVGEFSVPPKANGKGSFNPRCMVAFDPAVGGRPAQGDTVGSVVGNWYAKKGNAGYVVYGGTAANWAAVVRAAGDLTVGEADGSPSYAGVTTLQFDQADGFSVSQPSAGVARVDIDPSKATDCVGCGWFAGMGLTRCLRVTAAGVATSLYLSTTDGDTWTSADLLTICAVDYTVTVHRNAGGVPTLTLTSTGSGAISIIGQWNCCGCGYAKWTFNLQTLCPDEPDTGDACTNVVEIRVDSFDCVAPPGGASCAAAAAVSLGQTMIVVSAFNDKFWKLNVTGGTTYHMSYTQTNPPACAPGCGVFNGTLYVPDCSSSEPVETEFTGLVGNSGCVEFTPSQDGCLCLEMLNDNVFNNMTMVVNLGPCP